MNNIIATTKNVEKQPYKISTVNMYTAKFVKLNEIILNVTSVYENSNEKKNFN